MTKVLTRREFLKNSAIASAAGALYLGSPVSIFSQTDRKTRVVLIRDKNVLDAAGNPRADVIQNMLDQAVTRLLDEQDVTKAWQRLIIPTDIVGIKTNIWQALRTPVELEQALKKRVLGAGVPEKNISINDRGLLSDPIFLKATALINTRPMRTHDWSGVGSLIKNYIMFVEKPYEYHPDTCADLAAIWKLPLVKDKTRLNVLVMLAPLFHSVGPHGFNAKHIWRYKGLIVGLDPVACDSTGVRIIMAKRKEYFGEERPINPPPKHIFLADARHHLGVADPQKIELIKLGWEEDILIEHNQ